MTIRANNAMKELIPSDIGHLSSLQCSLPEKLRQAVEEAKFTEVGGLVTFAGSPEPSTEARMDLTGLECLLNKWQMDAYMADPNPSLQKLTVLGVCFALALRERLLCSDIRGELRLIVSSNRALEDSLPNTCTVHLHKLRPDNPWLSDGLKSYGPQGVLTIDWLNSVAERG